ncbi:hypothetical protein AY606_12620 [Acinetobacter sp. SFB]|uniref:hypothetical protein n=1 Tax=Acinetobacter sp. SFB TaxID=1805634 RepID=UPI0007D86D6F|nr:hypothetical protein [Acinetobacter sp. SFB]OAL76802.1 hypothetical protein AY606_12620 [Acinetobacter sp. SFB]
MTINKYLFFSVGILFNQITIAGTFTETFQGTPKLNINLYAFAADIDGSINKGRIKYDVDQSFEETIKHLDRSYMAHVDLRQGAWGIYTDLQNVETSQEKNVMNLPIALSTQLKQNNYGIYYQAYISPELTSEKEPRLVIEPTIGIHRIKVEATLTVLNQYLETDTKWNEFFWGSRFKYNTNTPWNLASELTFGAENTLSAQAYLGYRIPIFDRALNLRAGYRYLEQDYRSNNFHWDIRQHGPVIGINLPIF